MIDWMIESQGEKWQVRLPSAIVSGRPFVVKCGDRTFHLRWENNTRSFFALDPSTGLEECLKVRGKAPSFSGEEFRELSYHLDSYESSSVSQKVYPKYVEVASRSKGERSGTRQIKASITGKVIKVFKSIGDPIANGERFAVIEAMKMENNIVSPCSGICAEVGIQDGALVTMGDTLLKVNQS